MEVAVIGTGYVGLVAGTCIADLGNNVVCVDVDESKIEKLRRGISPIYEPGLEELIKKNVSAGRLSFTTDIESAIKKAYVIFIAVGTPQSHNGKADLKYVRQAAEQIGSAMNGEKVVVNKSTSPIGTSDMIRKIISRRYKGEFHVVSNPEFLREGSAVNDFLEPDRVVIGYEKPKAREVMEKLYTPLKAEKFYTDLHSAELIKYASNAFLAVKISFINEVALLCDKVGANIKDVSRGVGMDSRINHLFLRAGCGWGGSCFPKDVSALIHMGREGGVDLRIPKAAKQSNVNVKTVPVEKLRKRLGKLRGKKIALFGLAFKPNTDDVRDASSITIANRLRKAGAHVVGYDPVAADNAKRFIPWITYAKDAYEAASGADAIILVTEWPEFSVLDYAKMKKLMKKPLIVDGRNFLDKKSLASMGFEYEGMGV